MEIWGHATTVHASGKAGIPDPAAKGPKILVEWTQIPGLAPYEATLAAMEAVNDSGEAYLSPTTVNGTAAIRLAVGSWRTTRADVDRTWRALQEAADRG